MSDESRTPSSTPVGLDLTLAPRTIMDGVDGKVIYYPSLLPTEYAWKLFEFLKANINWEQREMRAYGKVMSFPRLIAWFNTKRDNYAFSGISVASQPVPGPIQKLFDSFEVRFGLTFNSVLLNYYRDGNDSISWHTDAEPELGENPTVASISLGATRRFMLRRERDKESISIDLEHGSVLIMREAMMHLWKHQIPKQPKIHEPRINLTFRFMHPAADAAEAPPKP